VNLRESEFTKNKQAVCQLDVAGAAPKLLEFKEKTGSGRDLSLLLHNSEPTLYTI
jgi:hypothetical protein